MHPLGAGRSPTDELGKKRRMTQFILRPPKVYLYASLDGDSYRLLSIKDTPSFQNAKHDAWIDGVLFEGIDVNTRYLKVAFEADTPVYMDELFVNPVIR